MPTYSQVITDINQKIIPNDNQEITANVLRPILIDMLDQINDLTGDPANINLAPQYKNNIVNAINEIISQLGNIKQFNVFTGNGNPNIFAPTPNPVPFDFYARQGVNEVYVYNGIKWVLISDNYISYSSIQNLTQSQKNTALSNIGGLAVDMSNLPLNLTTSEKNIIKNKLDITDQTITLNFIGNGNAVTDIVQPNPNSNYLEVYKNNTFLQSVDLDGFVYDVTYTSSNHVLTFFRQNEPNIIIDLPIEQLITGVQLVGDDLIFTFEDGSTVTVPLNTLLVGVVKFVNGVAPNSSGNVVLNISDIPNLQSVLNGKQDKLTAGTNITIDPLTNVISSVNTTYLGSASIILAAGNVFQRAALTGDVTSPQNSNAVTIAQNAVTNAKLADVPTATMKGRVSAGTGDPTDLTPAQIRTLLNVADGANNYILPISSPTVLGGIMVGANLTIDANGVLSATSTNITQVLSLTGQILSLSNGGGSVTLPFTDWADITNKPTTFTPSPHTHPSSDVVALTGYVLGTNTAILATDSLNVALGKIQAQINSKTNNTGTVTSVTAGTGLTGGTITTSGTIALNAATIASLNLANTALQAGNNISLLNNDVGYITASSLPVVGNGALSISVPTGFGISGAFSANQTINSSFNIVYASGYQGYTTAEANKLASLSNYILPTASPTVLGGIKVGTNLSIDANGVLSSVNTTYLGSTSIILSSGSFQRAALTGDVVASLNSNATTIAANVVTFAKMQQIPTATFLGRVTAGTGNVEALTAAQMQAALGYLTSFTETDPTVPAHVKAITTGDITNWNNKFTFPAGGNATQYINGLGQLTTFPTLQNLTQGNHISFVGNAITVTPTVNTWISDSTGANRMYFASGNPTSDVIMRLSDDTGVFNWRKATGSSANATLATLNQTTGFNLPIWGGYNVGAQSSNASLTRNMGTVSGGWARNMHDLIVNGVSIDIIGHFGSAAGALVYGYIGGTAYNTKNPLRWSPNGFVGVGLINGAPVKPLHLVYEETDGIGVYIDRGSTNVSAYSAIGFRKGNGATYLGDVGFGVTNNDFTIRGATNNTLFRISQASGIIYSNSLSGTGNRLLQSDSIGGVFATNLDPANIITTGNIGSYIPAAQTLSIPTNGLFSGQAGAISISSGNTVNLPSLGRVNLVDFNDISALGYGLTSFFNSTGSSNYPSGGFGAGILLARNVANTAGGNFALWTSTGNVNELKLNISGNAGWFGWETVATREWVTTQIPVIGNGNISYTGTGNITGGGLFTANQVTNTSFTFDLTSQTKTDISLGVTANSWGNHALAGYAKTIDLANYVPISRTLTINGVTFDLSANRTWNIPVNTYTSSNGILLTGFNFTPIYGTTVNTIAQGNDSRIINGQAAFDWGRGLRVEGLGVAIHNSTSIDAFTVRNSSVWAASGANRPNGTNSAIVNFTPYNSGGTYGFSLGARLGRLFFVTEENSVMGSWSEIITATNIASQIGNNAWTITGNQSNLSGVKTTSGTIVFNGTQATPLFVGRTGTALNSNVAFGFDGTWNAYVGLYDSNTFVIGNSASMVLANRSMWLDIPSGLLTSKGGFAINGQTNASMLLAGGGFRPVSDFALVGSVPAQVNILQGAGILVSGTYPNITITNNSPNATHTGDVTGATVLTISPNVVTFAKMQQIPTATFLGRVTAGTGNVEALTATQMQAALGYLTSFTETDPTVPSHVKAITTIDINNWNTAFNWGPHAGLYAPLSHTHPSSDVVALTGYVLGTNTAILATDSLNVALGKIQAQINAKTSNTGTVTSVAISLPNIFSVTGSPITTSGVFSATLVNQTANTFFAAPNGSNGAPVFRAIVAADIPLLNQNTTGSAATLTTARTISMTGDVAWSVSFNGGSNVTAAGTIAAGAVNNTKMANMAADTFKGRLSTNGAPQDLTVSQMRTVLGIVTPNNGIFTVTGIGSLTGGGSTSADTSLNTNANLDLTPQTKSDIQTGVDASNRLTDMFGNASYFDFKDVSSGGFVDVNENFYNLLSPMGNSTTVDVSEHTIHGARLVLRGTGSSATVVYNLKGIGDNGNPINFVSLENGGVEFTWDNIIGYWRKTH